MTQIGLMRATSKDGNGDLHGQIQTLTLDLKFRLTRNGVVQWENAPSHRVMAFGSHGGEVQIGAAWTKVAKTIAHAGEEFLSITFDDPGLEVPLNVSAFPDEDGLNWTIVWRRKRVEPLVAASNG